MSDGNTSRRTVFKALGATLGAGAFARAVAPIASWPDDLSMDELLQRHYKELSRAEMDQVLRRLEQETAEDHGVAVTIADDRPTPGVSFGYALNLSICIGCRRCAEACHIENNHDRATDNSYIRVLEIDKGTVDLAHARRTTTAPSPRRTSTTCRCSATSVTSPPA